MHYSLSEERRAEFSNEILSRSDILSEIHPNQTRIQNYQNGGTVQLYSFPERHAEPGNNVHSEVNNDKHR